MLGGCIPLPLTARSPAVRPLPHACRLGHRSLSAGPRRMTKSDVAGNAQPGQDEVTTVIDLARRNLRLLSCLVLRYEVDRGEIVTEERIVRGPADVVDYLGAELADLAQEQLRTILLDTKNRVLGTSLVYHGGLNSIVVRLADCFREAVRRNAAAILLVHNHPSRDPEPSPEDVRVTREAAQVGELRSEERRVGKE